MSTAQEWNDTGFNFGRASEQSISHGLEICLLLDRGRDYHQSNYSGFSNTRCQFSRPIWATMIYQLPTDSGVRTLWRRGPGRGPPNNRHLVPALTSALTC